MRAHLAILLICVLIQLTFVPQEATADSLEDDGGSGDVDSSDDDRYHKPTNGGNNNNRPTHGHGNNNPDLVPRRGGNPLNRFNDNIRATRVTSAASSSLYQQGRLMWILWQVVVVVVLLEGLDVLSIV